MSNEKSQVLRQKIELKPEDKRLTFVLEGKLIFKACNIEDAITEIRDHFNEVLHGNNGIGLPGTDISIRPI